jgi:hypothetical protein
MMAFERLGKIPANNLGLQLPKTAIPDKVDLISRI